MRISLNSGCEGAGDCGSTQPARVDIEVVIAALAGVGGELA
jgi:hypothetical protein